MCFTKARKPSSPHLCHRSRPYTLLRPGSPIAPTSLSLQRPCTLLRPGSPITPHQTVTTMDNVPYWSLIAPQPPTPSQCNAPQWDKLATQVTTHFQYNRPCTTQRSDSAKAPNPNSGQQSPHSVLSTTDYPSKEAQVAPKAPHLTFSTVDHAPQGDQVATQTPPSLLVQ